MALKTNEYENENEVAHYDCSMTHITSLFNRKAIIITDLPGNTIVSLSSVIK